MLEMKKEQAIKLQLSLFCYNTKWLFFFLNQERIKGKKIYVSLVRHKWCCIHNILLVWSVRPPSSMCLFVPTLVWPYITWYTHVFTLLLHCLCQLRYIPFFPSWHLRLFENVIKAKCLILSRQWLESSISNHSFIFFSKFFLAYIFLVTTTSPL